MTIKIEFDNYNDKICYLIMDFHSVKFKVEKEKKEIFTNILILQFLARNFDFRIQRLTRKIGTKICMNIFFVKND